MRTPESSYHINIYVEMKELYVEAIVYLYLIALCTFNINQIIHELASCQPYVPYCQYFEDWLLRAAGYI